MRAPAGRPGPRPCSRAGGSSCARSSGPARASGRPRACSTPGDLDVHGERANFTRLVLGCIEADFCNQILVFIGKNFFYLLENSRQNLHNALRSTALQSHTFYPKLCRNFSNRTFPEFYRIFANFSGTYLHFCDNFLEFAEFFV